MWQPTHVKVTVKQAKDLLIKGKNGTNDAFVVIGIGKEKYQTSVKEKSSSNVEWKEECELAIPSHGNKAAVVLTIYHHSSVGFDLFLGQVSLPLSDFDVYEKPKYRNYKLKGKPEKDKKKGEKERGQLDVMVHFTVKSGSLLDVSKKEKHKSSISSLKHLGGSLMSMGGKDKKGLKSFARSVSSQMNKIAKPGKKKGKSSKDDPEILSNNLMESKQMYGEADPGVRSDDEDDEFMLDDVKVYTQSSSPQSTMSRGSSLMVDQTEPDFDVVESYDDGLSFGMSAPHILDEIKDPSNKFLAGSERFTSLSESKPFSNMSSPANHTIHEESSLELKDNSFFSAKSGSTFYSPAKLSNDQHEDSYATLKDDEDSAICVDPPQSSSNASSAISLSNSSPMESKNDLKMAQNSSPLMSKEDLKMTPSERTLSKSSSAVTLRHGSVGSRRGNRELSATDSWSFDTAGVTRSGSLSEKRSSQPIIMDEWERKLYGRTGITGSTENMSIDGSRTSLNSRASSTGTQEIMRDDSFNRLPEVKVLTLERKDELDARKPKKHKTISSTIKNKFWSKSADREKPTEEKRIVEGSSDPPPYYSSRHSKIPQEIHNKFTGKTREDLLGTIVSQQAVMEKQIKHTHDLEDYIDNLLLRVMDINPTILQAPLKKNKSFSRF